MPAEPLRAPVSTSSPVGVFSLRNDRISFGMPQVTRSVTGIGAVAGLYPAGLIRYLPAAIWLLGCLGLAAWLLSTHLRCRRDCDASLPVDSAYVGEWMRAHDPLGTVRVRYSDRIMAPLTYGIVSPLILLPAALGTET